MKVNTIIVQAGGKGSRMLELTRNKPKALVPVNNLPMIFHLFRKYPESRYIVIGDYKADVLEKYLAAFAEVDYTFVNAKGAKGTCGGLQEALACVPEKTPFMLIWCDLVLPQEYEMPAEDADYIGISKDFPCRWKYEDGVFAEERSSEHGVAGHFIFRDKESIADVPAEGEFVRWLQGKGMTFTEWPLYKTHEYGLYSEWEKLPRERCRPFNRMEIDGDRITKIPVDAQGEGLARREVAWYRRLQGHHFENIPKIYGYEPLSMERIDGKNIYEYTDIPAEQKKKILRQVIACLRQIQAIEGAPADRDSYYDAYIGKTFKRLEKVYDLVPFAKDPVVTVNGKACRNVFFHRKELEEKTMAYLPKEFRLIHGDCTFSNMMLRSDGTPVMIDPRGYFGTTEFFGDPAYDWVKVYYSLVGNYDQFNLKRFHLEIGEKDVRLEIASNHWEEMEDEFFRLLSGDVTREQMRLLLAIIWLSLTTYAWEDYDSICGAFYNGLLYLEEAL
ncbi:MAG: phosphotransferase [Clostridia bacterium]|nr:phosphotransferase [Clostridia bacterium]